jgi:hypothetical protein
VSSRWDAAELALRRLHLATIEPLLIAAKKRRRLELFGAGPLADLPSAELDLQLNPRRCVANCVDFTTHERPQLSPFLFRNADGRLPPSRLGRGVPCVIDLDRFADFDAYLARLKRHSKGGIIQQIRKARAQGFYSKTMLRDLYHRQIHEIQSSKRFRSGPVLAAFVKPMPQSDFAGGITLADIAFYLGKPLSEVVQGVAFPEPPLAPCPHHWSLDWGAFIAEPVRGAGDILLGERLVAYIFLKRIGNIVRTRGVMGHGAFLSRNVVKLLLHDVVRWLLARQDPRVEGVRYLHYGAMEHGSDGLAAWKRSFGFAPMPFRWAAQPDQAVAAARTNLASRIGRLQIAATVASSASAYHIQL